MKLKKTAVYIIAMVFVFIFTFAGKASKGEAPMKIPVLLYHHILTDAENKWFINESTITPEVFDAHMSYLYNNGYTTITSQDIFDFIYNNKKIDGKKVLITFDDGYLSNCIYAYDILKKYNFSATIFLITGVVGEQTEEFNPDIINFMSREDMLKYSDVFEYASHTNDMHRKNEAGTAYLLFKPKDEIEKDIAESFGFYEINRFFAYPYGEYNQNVIEVLKGLDCPLAFGNYDKYVTKNTNPYNLPRFSIKRSTSLEYFTNIFSQPGK